MKYLAVKLKPKSSFHLGERERWAEGSKVHFPADTIFSALSHCYLLLYGDVKSFFEEFLNGQPPFLISSAFPFWLEEYYFPLPKNKFLKAHEVSKLSDVLKEKLSGKQKKAQEISLKEIKKIQYVNLCGLSLLLNGQSLFDLILAVLEDRRVKTIPLLFASQEEEKPDYPWKKRPWTIENVPRIALSRFSNHPGEQFFHFGRVHYDPKAGLFLLLKINHPDWEKKLKSLFYLLADEGVGGDRTCGHGLLERPDFVEIELPEIKNGQGLYFLSPYFPADDEHVNLAQGFYELEERKGYIFSLYGRSLRRRSIRLFAEGSVFPGDKERRGKLVDITPEIFKAHPVYRYGYAFTLPCQLEEGHEN